MIEPKDTATERAIAQSDAEAALDEQILDEIMEELNRQQSLKHGGNTEEFDKTNTRNDWIAYCNAYLGRAAQKVFRNEREGQEFEANMIKVAALVVSAIRAHRKGYC
jgi:hypothetical protein